MRRVVVFALMLAGMGQWLVAQGNDPSAKQISVIGSVEVKEVADQASLVFSIKGVGSSLHRAVEDANKKVLSLTNKLLLLGLSQKNISTSQFYSGENYGDKAFLSSSRDFQAVLSTLINIDSLALLDTVLYTISDAGVENLSGISFSFKDELGLRRKARIAAASKAREKAEDISNALGANLGSVIKIEELELPPTANQEVGQSFLRGGRVMGYVPNPFNPVTVADVAERNAFDESTGSGLFAQTISITSQVRVTFELK